MNRLAAIVLFASLITSGSIGGQVAPPSSTEGNPLSQALESAVVIEAAKRILKMGEKTVIVPGRVCSPVLRDRECPDSAQEFVGPPLSTETLRVLNATFGRGKADAEPPELQLQRPLLRNDTVIVVMYVTRPATDMPNGEKGYYELDEYDIKLTVKRGYPQVLSCDPVWHATVQRIRKLGASAR